MKAREFMTEEVTTLRDTMTLEEAAQILIKYEISGAPVVDDQGRLVGVLSEGDLIRQQKPLSKPMMFTFLDGSFPVNYREINDELSALTAMKVEELMTDKVFSLDAEVSAQDVVRLMLDKKVNRVPIVEEGMLIGIVSRQDIIRALLDSGAAVEDRDLAGPEDGNQAPL